MSKDVVAFCMQINVKKGPSTVHGRTGWERDANESECKKDYELNENERKLITR